MRGNFRFLLRYGKLRLPVQRPRRLRPRPRNRQRPRSPAI